MSWKAFTAAAALILFAFVAAPLAPARADDAKLEKELSELDNNPLFKAIYEHVPGSRDEIRTRLKAAYKKGGIPEVQREGGRIGQKYGAQVAPMYLAKARGEDLLNFIRVGRDISGYLRTAAPEVCFAWLFAPQEFDAVAFAQRVGPDLQNRLNTSLMDVVTNAHKATPEFDQATAQAALQQVATAVMSTQPAEVSAFFSGTAKIETVEQKGALCGFNHDLYKAVLDHPQSVDILRIMFLAI